MPLKFSGRGWPAWVLAAALVALAIGDVLTTEYILARGGYEGNPVVAWLMDMLGHAGAFSLKVIATAGIALWLVGAWEYRLAKVAMGIALALHCAVVGRHLFYIVGGYV